MSKYIGCMHTPRLIKLPSNEVAWIGLRKVVYSGSNKQSLQALVDVMTLAHLTAAHQHTCDNCRQGIDLGVCGPEALVEPKINAQPPDNNEFEKRLANLSKAFDNYIAQFNTKKRGTRVKTIFQARG